MYPVRSGLAPDGFASRRRTCPVCPVRQTGLMYGRLWSVRSVRSETEGYRSSLTDRSEGYRSRPLYLVRVRKEVSINMRTAGCLATEHSTGTVPPVLAKVCSTSYSMPVLVHVPLHEWQVCRRAGTSRAVRSVRSRDRTSSGSLPGLAGLSGLETGPDFSLHRSLFGLRWLASSARDRAGS